LSSRADFLRWLEARLSRPYDRSAFGFDPRAVAK
jgi:hypothetical protein